MLGGSPVDTLERFLWGLEIDLSIAKEISTSEPRRTRVSGGTGTSEYLDYVETTGGSVNQLQTIAHAMSLEPSVSHEHRATWQVPEATRLRALELFGALMRDPWVHNRSCAVGPYLAFGGGGARAVDVAIAARVENHEANDGIFYVASAAAAGQLHVELIRSVLRSDDPDRRIAGIEIVREMRADGAALLPELAALTRDPNIGVAQSAQEAMETIRHWVRWERRGRARE